MTDDLEHEEDSMLETAIETKFFARLAGPERTHDHKRPTPLPFGPLIIIVTMALLLVVVFWIVLMQAIVKAKPDFYYAGSDVVGLIVTMLLFAGLAWSFAAAAMTDPGIVPRMYPWDPTLPDPDPSLDMSGEDESASLQMPQAAMLRGSERKLDGRTRFCKKCNVYKPDRAHHCKRLGRCVLEMDHWCPWIRNTVGFQNRKYFFLTVTYGWTTLMAFCITLGPYLPAAARLRGALDFFTIFCWVIGAIECCMLFALWTFHIYLTIHGFTTIEFREKHLAKETKVVKTGERLRDLYHKSAYDWGVYENFVHLLGPHVYLWIIPTRIGMVKDATAGAVFRIRDNHPLAQNAHQSSGGSSMSRIQTPHRSFDNGMGGALQHT